VGGKFFVDEIQPKETILNSGVTLGMDVIYKPVSSSSQDFLSIKE